MFPDVAQRLEAALHRRGIPDPQQWLEDVEGDLDRALAETVTLAADDVLLDGLLASLQDAPPARELISGIAVYRRPFDETGVAWQLSQLSTVPAPPPGLLGRLQPVWESLRQARQSGTAGSVEDLGLEPGALAQYRDDAAELARPPVSLSGEARRALSLLADLGLVAPVTGQDTNGQPDGPGLFVHRWTAAALEARTSPAELTGAHRRAAAYWRWRVRVWPQTRAEDVEQLLEARYHHHAAGDLDDALDANQQACSQLRTWGAWTTERQLWDEALGWVPPRSSHAADIRYELGILARNRGDYNTAEDHYQAALAVFEEIGHRVGIASVYHQLGMLAQGRGDYNTAEQRYQTALAIDEEIGNRAGSASSYGQLGNLAYDHGDYNTAEQRYQAALAVFEEIGDRANISGTYHQLGTLAQARGDYNTAEQRYQAALAVFEEIGHRAGIAIAYHQLGNLAYLRGDDDTAEQHYQAALAITEEIGNRAGLASSYHQLGMLAQRRGDDDTAEQHYQASLAIKEEIGDRAGLARTLSQLGVVRTDQGRPADAVSYQVQGLAIRIELSSSDSAIDVRMLRRQRAALGDQEFQRILRTLVDDDDVAAIMQITEQAG